MEILAGRANRSPHGGRPWATLFKHVLSCFTLIVPPWGVSAGIQGPVGEHALPCSGRGDWGQRDPQPACRRGSWRSRALGPAARRSHSPPSSSRGYSKQHGLLFLYSAWTENKRREIEQPLCTVANLEDESYKLRMGEQKEVTWETGNIVGPLHQSCTVYLCTWDIRKTILISYATVVRLLLCEAKCHS